MNPLDWPGESNTTLPAVFFRVQKGLCCHCRKLMQWRRQRLDHPLAWSREHVIPRAHGGPSGPTNYLLAHRRCNERRRDAAPTHELIAYQVDVLLTLRELGILRDDGHLMGFKARRLLTPPAEGLAP